MGGYRNAGRQEWRPLRRLPGQSEPCNAGRRGRRPVRRNWDGFVLSKPLCHPTLASPLPPSYEEGALRRRRCANFRTSSVNVPCRGRHSWRPARSKFRLPEAPVTPHGLEYPAAAAAPLFPKKGSGNKVAALRAAFIKKCAAKRRKPFKKPPPRRRGAGGKRAWDDCAVPTTRTHPLPPPGGRGNRIGGGYLIAKAPEPPSWALILYSHPLSLTPPTFPISS